MAWLVDGDNLLGTWRGRARSSSERRALAFELGRFAAAAGKRLVVVFDGTSPDPLGPDVLFAGPGSSADQVILDRLSREADPRGWTVVTSDRSLGDRSRWLGARHERCDRFRARLSAASRGSGDKPQRETDIAAWLEAFGDPD